MEFAIGSPSKKRKIAHAVFPKVVHTQPTPEATPNIGSISFPGQSFGGFNDHVSREVELTRAWSAATRTLVNGQGKKSSQVTKLSESDASAFELILQDKYKRRELAIWWVHLIRMHPWGTMQDDCPNVWLGNNANQKKDESQSSTPRYPVDHIAYIYEVFINPKLEQIRAALVRRDRHLEALLPPFKAEVEKRMTSILHDLFPKAESECGIRKKLLQSLRQSLHSNSNNPEDCTRQKTCECRISIDSQLLISLRDLGLSQTAQSALSHALSDFMLNDAVERRCFAVDWEGQESVVPRLRAWMRDHFCTVIDRSMMELHGRRVPFGEANSRIEDLVVRNAVVSLCFKRAHNLFDYVKTWPHSKGAILDIKELLADQKSDHKSNICFLFTDAVEHRLLHAGASTTELLSFYINVINVFRTLDSRGVLLTKVAQPIRAHLRAREDTVAIIAASFLADVEENGAVKQDDEGKVCSDFAREVNGASLEDLGDDRIHDWDDMNWQPDPIDAGPDYRSSKKEDVITCILNLFPHDDFIKEVTSVLARHLLDSTSPEFAKETRLVELFKSRFDPAKLQSAEVMLRDIRTSANVSKKVVRPETAVPVDAQILSSYFWPQMRNNTFGFPTCFHPLLNNFFDAYNDQGFGSAQQKLHARPALTKITIELELEDRVIEEKDIPAWRASVIGAFLSDAGQANLSQSDSETITTTSAELAHRLAMDDELVADSLNFWLSRRVLYKPTPDTYAVLERLDMDTAAPTTAAAAAQPEIAAVMSHDAVLKEKAPMFEIFIGNMLKNGPPKEVGGMMGIANMLRMVLPDFTYGDKEVLFLLGNLEARGEVVKAGETWTVAK
ncbi:hypothetical protein MBLNU230_g1381t1 [Neophaeotheca triangularis]